MSKVPLDEQIDFPLGAHLVTSRIAYTHHGIYVGDGKVVHYSGLAVGLKAGPVEEVSITAFSGGYGYSIKLHPNAKYTGEQVVGRGRSRVGEDCYCVFANNCEHFCEWCIYGGHHSDQIDRGATASGVGGGAVAGFAARAAVAASGTVVGLSGPGIMSGLASVGAVVGGGAAAGLGVLGGVQGVAMASLVNNTLLKDNPALGEHDLKSRLYGRYASYAGAAAGTAGGIASVSAFGSVVGLSAAGMASGLATVGGVVGGGMAMGVVLVTAAPVVAAAAGGYGIYKIAKMAMGPDSQAIAHDEKASPTIDISPS